MYGKMVEILVYFRGFCKTWLAAGLKLNPHDTCVSNRMLNGKQQTIFWHLDNCNLSHMYPNINEKLIEVLKQKYYIIFKYGSGDITVNFREIHKYLGMTIDYTNKGLCKIMVFNYIKEILYTFDYIDPKATGTKSSAAPTKLFVVRYDCTKLNTIK